MGGAPHETCKSANFNFVKSAVTTKADNLSYICCLDARESDVTSAGRNGRATEAVLPQYYGSNEPYRPS